MKKKKYYYCLTDSYGQRSGYVRDIELYDNDITKDSYGNLYYKNLFLYEDYSQAVAAAHS